MNIHNDLYSKYEDGVIGMAEVLTAFDKGLIDHESVAVISAVVPVCSIETLIINRTNEFNYFCERSISRGIDVTLSDGSIEHYSLSDKDQINILRNITNAVMGMEELEYHADGGPQKTYSVEDMNRIYSTMQAKINSETTYRNNLREWIQRMNDFESIRKIRYGDEIPEEYWTEGWRNIQTRVSRMDEANSKLEPEGAVTTSEPDLLCETADNGGIVSKVVTAVTKKKTRKKKTETE